MRLLAICALLLLVPGIAGARQFSLGDLTVMQPWVRATIGQLRNTAGYLAIVNGSGVTQRLVAVEIAGAEQVEIHETRDGMMMLVEGVEIAPGQSLSFAPGGWHLMIGPLAGPLAEGGTVAGTLVFEPAGRLEVVFAIESANATESHDHQ